MNPPDTELFLASCGASGSPRLLAAGPLTGQREHVFDRPFLVAGSDPRCCLRLDDPAVSRRHAYFQLVEGRLLAIDLGSRTGLVWPRGNTGGCWVSPEGVRLGPWWLAPFS